MGVNKYRIETERLCIRPFAMADADAFYAITREPALFTYLPDKMPVYEEVQGLIRWLMEQYGNDDLGHFKYSFAVTLMDTGELIGWCGLGDLDFDPEKKELFYGYGKQYWGRGYGYEAARAMVDTAFQVLGLPLLTAVTKPANVSSVRIIEKCGFVYGHMVSGIAGRHAWYNGERYYEMNRARYDEVKKANQIKKEKENGETERHTQAQ
jgi:ribosomal-protein-alanine N-acetyltransferase